MKYNKRARDKIVSRLKGKGHRSSTYIADEQEYYQPLKGSTARDLFDYKGSQIAQKCQKLKEQALMLGTPCTKKRLC